MLDFMANVKSTALGLCSWLRNEVESMVEWYGGQNRSYI